MERGIIQRHEWGAQHEDGFGPRPVGNLEPWLHHSVTIAPDLLPPFDDDYRAIRTLEKIGEERFGRGISYHIPITPIGLIFEGLSIDRVGAHIADYNTGTVGIVFVGNYEISRPTLAQLQSLDWVLHHGVARGWWRSPRLAGGHGDAPGAATACPGRFVKALIPDINRGVYHDGRTPDAGPRPTQPEEYELMRHLDLTDAHREPVTGQHVKTLQGQLLAHGFGPKGLVDAGGHPDGVAGPATRRFTGKFQRRTKTGNADGTPDYLVYDATWQALLGL